MGFATGQTIRINENAPVAEYAKGRLAMVDGVVKTPKGKRYIVALSSLRMQVDEADLRLGPDEIVH